MSDSPHLAPAVHKQLARLKGGVPKDFAPRDRMVDTPAGPRPVPPSVQALIAVTWPEKHVMLTKNEFNWEVGIGFGAETEQGLIREDRAWYTVGYDDGQYYTVVDLDQAAGTDDPLTYHVDHEGDEPVPWGQRLSECLAGYKVKRPPAKKNLFARACAAGDTEAVEAALAGGASVGPVNTTGITPLHLAALASRSPELVRRLIEAGADVNAAIVRTIPSMHTFVESDRLYGRHLAVGDTALYAAVSGLSYWPDQAAPVAHEMVRILLAAGADPNARNEYGHTLLWLTVTERGERCVDVVKQLLAAGADSEPAGVWESPLRAAVSSGSVEIITALLDAGADPCRATSTEQWGVKGVTPLHTAALHGSEPTLRLMIDAAGDLDVRTVGGVTPLQFVVREGGPDRVRMLLEAGADPRAELPDPKVLGADSDARTPLEIARHLGKDEVAAVLEEFLAR